MKFIIFLFGLTTLTASTIGFAQNSPEKEWQNVYDAREAFYEKKIGKLPNDIMKAPNLFVVWPGGGFYLNQHQLARKLNLILTPSFRFLLKINLKIDEKKFTC